MDLKATCEINFFGMQDSAVGFAATSEPSQLPFTEQLLYACLTLRQLVNMKGDRFAARLSEFLFSVGKHPHQFISADLPFHIVEFAGVRAKKRFVADLSVKAQRVQFKLTVKGLGLFERYLRYYASASVMVLYYYLVTRRKSDSQYQSQIARIGSLCAGVYLSDQLTILNQAAGALQLVKEVTGKSS